MVTNVRKIWNMKLIRYMLPVAALLSLAGCYGDYTHDFEDPNMGFALEKPLRTVIADRNMEIYVGVSIGGLREDYRDAWARFVIDESLVGGTGKTLLPSSHYKLGDSGQFKVRKDNLPVADVKVEFTDSFFADPLSLDGTYVLPFRMTENSLGSIREGAETSIVAIKYISTYAGTYYRLGSVTANGTVTSFGNSTDLVKCDAVPSTTQSKARISLPGFGNLSFGTLILDVSGSSVSLSVDDASTLVSGSGSYTKEGKYDFVAEKGVKAPQIDLDYVVRRDGVDYHVKETLVLRQDPIKDLRVETW